MITGGEYTLRGETVTVLAQWNGAKPPPVADPRLIHLRTGRTAPRNVLIQYADGRLEVRPFRGLRRTPEGGPQ